MGHFCFFSPGAFYFFTVDQLKTTGSFQSGRVAYVLDSEDQGDHVDIDTQEDFVRAELMIKKHSAKFELDQLVPKSANIPISGDFRSAINGFVDHGISGVANGSS